MFINSKKPYNYALMVFFLSIGGGGGGEGGGGQTMRISPKITYQPEDRYGYISDLTANADDGHTYNFLTINTGTLAKPYVRFYDANGTVIGGVEKGIDLSVLQTNSTETIGTKTADHQYCIRLPKNAASVQIYDDETAVGETIALNDDGGSTLTVDNNQVTKTKTERTTSAITYPLEPTTDFDYIYFTDEDNWSNGGAKTIYAYYYGSADGEYAAWPGVPAQNSYVDNRGNRVYRFQPPKSVNGTYPYPYVIFHNGSAPDRTITQRIQYQMGHNYTPNNNTSVPYGTVTNHAYGVSDNYKAQGKPDDIDTNTEIKTKLTNETDWTQYYIFFVNNGTKDLMTEVSDTSNRYRLDDVHIKFFSDEKGDNAVGNTAGYLMSQLMAEYENDDVYRIRIPNGAAYFRITNGTGKDTISSGNYYRSSEIKEITNNGLYRFVRIGSTYDDYAVGCNTQLTTPDSLDDYRYRLELLNETEDPDVPPVIIGGDSTPVHLATVETGYDGLIKQITWLRHKPIEGMTYDEKNPTTYDSSKIDTEYLDHTTDDLNNPSVTAVRTVKWGTYYWKEIQAPFGYEIDTEILPDFTIGAQEAEMTLNVQSAADSPKNGSVELTKTAKEKAGKFAIGTTLEGFAFRLYDASDSSVNLKLVKKANAEEYYFYPEEPSDKQQTILTNMLSQRINPNDDTSAYVWEHDEEGTDFKYYNVPLTITVDEEEKTIINLPKTNGEGKLKIDNIPWGTYYLEETEARENAGFVITDSNDQNNEKKVTFTIGKNNSERTLNLSVQDEIEPAYIRLFEHINLKKDGWGDPTFVFRITQTAQYELEYDDETKQWVSSLKDLPQAQQTVRYVSLTVNDDGTVKETPVHYTQTNDGRVPINFESDPYQSDKYTSWLCEGTTEEEYKNQFHIDTHGRIRVEPGSYEITRLPVSRYRYDGSAYEIYDTTEAHIPGTMTGAAEKVTLTGLARGKTADVHYYDYVEFYDKFSQVDTEVNRFYSLDTNHDNQHRTVKGIRIEDYHVKKTDVVVNDLLTVALPQNADFKAYMIMIDGSERLMTREEKKQLLLSYVYDKDSKDDISFGGNADTEKNDFSYDADHDYIKVANASHHKDCVYTLTADYHGYRTEFDLVMPQNERPTKFTTRQVIFRADNANTNATPTVSYFEDKLIQGDTISEVHSAEYEFTFIILDDQTKAQDATDKITVYDIRHNGRSIGEGNYADLLNAFINVGAGNSPFKINETFRTGSGINQTYAFGSWQNTSGEELNLTVSDPYSVIRQKIVSDLTKTSPIVFVAQLTNTSPTPTTTPTEP